MTAKFFQNSVANWLKEDHIELALCAGKVGVVEVNLLTGEIVWSPQHYMIFGVEPGTPITFDIFRSRVLLADLKLLDRKMSDAKVSRTQFEHQYRIVLPDGQIRSVVGRGKFVYGADGDASSMAGVVIDTTEVNALRLKLAARDREFAAVIENSAVMLARFSLDLKFLYVSSAVEAYTVFSAAQCVGKSIEELNFPSEISRQWMCSLREAISVRQSGLLRFSLRTLAGNEHFLESRFLPELAPLGDVESVLTITADITREEIARQEAQANDLRFRTLADAMPLLAWSAHADGFIHWYNQSWYEYTGTTEDSMAGWGWQSVHDPEILPSVLKKWKGSIALGEPFEMVFPLKGADGGYRSFLTRVRPVKSPAGNVLQWVGTNTDISGIEVPL